MNVVVDHEAFDELQNFLTGQIIEAVHRGLESLRLPRPELEEIINTIAFHVCCAIDGSTVMENNGRRVFPVLTFAESAEFEQVLSSGSTSFMHEYVHGATGQYLDEQA